MFLIQMVINWSIYKHIPKDTKMMSQNDITKKMMLKIERQNLSCGFMALHEIFWVRPDPILFLNDDGPVRYDLLPEVLGKSSSFFASDSSKLVFMLNGQKSGSLGYTIVSNC